jgi:hypothetical protein
VAVVAQLLLLDAAVETFLSGSPLRWSLSPPALLFVALSVWLWRPGGWLAHRRGWSGAASTSILALFGLLIASAWLPGGQVEGVRMLLQPTSRMLILTTAVAVGFAWFVLVGATVRLPATWRLAVRAVLVAAALYALVALALGIRDAMPFAALFQGGSAWQRLPGWLQGTVVGALGLLPLAILGQSLRFVDRRRKPARFLPQQTTVLVGALVIALSGLSTRSAAPIAGGGSALPRFEMASNEIVQLLKAYQDVAAHADRADFDVAAKASTLAGIGEAFVFVRDEIANDLYSGVLRGAEGTLSTGAGNDADKALLLARLLTEQKRTVRFAQGELPEDKAEERIRATFARPQRKSPNVDAMLLAALGRQGLSRGRAAEIVDARKTHEQAIDAAVASAAQADLATVRETLHAANIAPAPAFDRAALVTAARSHYWVQVEEGGRWQDLDPAFPNAQQGTSFCEAGQTMENLPPEVYQTVTVLVRNEYLENGGIQVITSLEHSFRTSDLHARSTLFLNMPLPLESVGAQGLAASQGFVPVLVAGDSAFHGDPFPLVSAPPPSGNAAGGMGSLFGSLGGGEAPSSPGGGARLVGQRLDFVIDGAGRQSTVSRTIFDGLRPDERVNGSITTMRDAEPLTRRLCAPYAIAVSTGRIHPVQSLEAAYAPIDASAVGRILGGLGGGGLSSETLSDFVVQRPRLLAVRALRLAAELDRAQSGAWRDGYRHSVLFRDQPLIVIADLAIGGADTETGLSFDLRHDEMRVMSDDTEHAEEAFWLNAHHGLVDGAVEGLALRSATMIAGHQDWAREGSARVVATSTVSELARTSRIGFRAATGDDAVRALRAFGAPGGFRLANEVRENTAAIMPARAVHLAGGDRLGMWALNLGSGHLIPLLDTGLRHAGYATGVSAEMTAGLEMGQPTGEYANTQRTRAIDLYWRQTQYQLENTWKLLQQWNCFGAGAATVQCKILQEAFNKIIGNASALKNQYWAMGEFLGGAV